MQIGCMKKCLAGYGVLAMLWASSSMAGPVLDFDQSLGGTGLNRDQTVGWEFNVVEPVAVTHLAWFDQDQNGLSSSHRVGLWDPDGSLVAESEVSSGTSSPLDGIWRIMDVADVVLPAADGYVIGGTNTASSTDRLVAGLFDISLDARIEHVETRYSDFGTELMLPPLSSVAVVGFYGPGFNVAPIPEPNTLLLLIIGGSGVLLRRRVRPRIPPKA